MAGNTLLMIGQIAAAAGSAVEGISSYNSTMMQSKVTQREGELARTRAASEAEAIVVEGMRVEGEARANAGAFGFDLSGSPSDIFGRLAAEKMAAARTAIYDGEVSYQNANAEAKQLKSAAQNQLFGKLLEAGAQGFGAYTTYQKGLAKANGIVGRNGGGRITSLQRVNSSVGKRPIPKLPAGFGKVKFGLTGG